MKLDGRTAVITGAASGRIRHGARFHRFRDDKEPSECRFEQLDEGG